MADDMANGDDAHRPNYPDPFQGAMGERVTNMGRRINDVEVEMRTGFNQVTQSIAALSNNLAERNKTQWPVIFLAIGVASSVLGYFVTQALTPIRDANLDMKAAIVETNKSIQALATNTVSRQEMDWRAARGAEDRAGVLGAITDLRAGTVTRSEWTERNRADEQQASDFSRRLEELRQDFGAVYGTRDVIQDMKKELEDLRRKVPST